MKKINEKGFTLVELLAVLVILITILMLAIPSITSSIERNKQKVYDKKIDIIEAAAEMYVDQYKNTISNYSVFISGECVIDIIEIQTKGILTEEDLKDANDNQITGYIKYNAGKYEYDKTGDVKNGDGVADTCS